MTTKKHPPPKLVKSLKLKSPARKDTAMRGVYESIGRDQMIETLHCSQDPRAQQLLETLLDPAYGQHSFPKLCERANLSMTEVVDLFRRYKLAEGIIAMAKHAPDILADTAIDAKSTKAMCMTCQGAGKVVVDADGTRDTCSACAGEGSIRIPGHDKARELFYKTMGLTGKEGRPLLAQQFNISSTPEMPRVEDFVNAAEEAMRGDKGRR